MTDKELAEEIERHLKETEQGDQWRAAPLLSFWRGEWQQIIAALRRGPERPDVNDLLDFIEAVAVKLMVPLVPRDGFSKRILDKLDWLILALNKYSEEDILQERPPSGEMVMVPREPTHYQIQLIFNTLMGELPEVKPDGWWGTSDQVAEAKKFYSELLSAAEAEGRKS